MSVDAFISRGALGPDPACIDCTAAGRDTAADAQRGLVPPLGDFGTDHRQRLPGVCRSCAEPGRLPAHAHSLFLCALNYPCEHCGASRFQREVGGFCCANG
eukprot:979115-Pyramimonas_sp.AAC.1